MADPRFVDVTYRGLKVAQKARLTDVENGMFLEHEAPLPVGAKIAIIDGSTTRDARVMGVVEQEASAKSPPGMRLMWADAVVRPAPQTIAPPPPEAPPPVVADAVPDPVPEVIEASDATIPVSVPDMPAPTGPEPEPAEEPAELSQSNGKRKRRPRKTIIGRPPGS